MICITLFGLIKLILNFQYLTLFFPPNVGILNQFTFGKAVNFRHFQNQYILTLSIVRLTLKNQLLFQYILIELMHFMCLKVNKHYAYCMSKGLEFKRL